jgi:hypothetical protein
MSISNLMSMDDIKSQTSKATNLTYVQRSADKDVQGESFNGGDITFAFTVGGNRWWIPSKTHFVIRSQLALKLGGGKPTSASTVAPAQLFASNLFQAADFRIEGRSVSRVSNRLAQVQAIKTRLTKTKAWRDSIGASLNYDIVDQKERMAEVSEDGDNKNSTFEVVWQPPCSIFDQDTPLPPGNYSIVLTPNSNYQKSCISTGEEEIEGGNAGVAIIGKIHLYVAQIDGETPPPNFT